MTRAFFPTPRQQMQEKTDAVAANSDSHTHTGDGVVMLFARLQQAPQDMHSFVIPKEKRIKGSPRNTWPCDLEGALHEDSWRNWPRAEMSGEPLLVAYAQSGATGNNIAALRYLLSSVSRERFYKVPIKWSRLFIAKRTPLSLSAPDSY